MGLQHIIWKPTFKKKFFFGMSGIFFFFLIIIIPNLMIILRKMKIGEEYEKKMN
jgi:hypothetical protein